MHIAVTGATGFIGSHLVQALTAAGWSVRAIVRQNSDTSRIESFCSEIFEGSLLDYNFLKDTLEGVDIAVNLAGKMGGAKTSKTEMFIANIHAVDNIADACSSVGVKQLIHCSTPGVAGMIAGANENSPYNPSGLYEQTKCQGEISVLKRDGINGLRVTIIRPDFVYGPGDHHKLKMFKAVQKGRFPIFNGGQSKLHPTYIDDVVKAFMLTINNPKAFGRIFHVAGPETVTVSHLVKAIEESLGIKRTKIKMPSSVVLLAAAFIEMAATLLHTRPPFTKYQVMFFSKDHTSDDSTTRQLLGYKPEVDIEEGIFKTLAWYIHEGYLTINPTDKARRKRWQSI